MIKLSPNNLTTESRKIINDIRRLVQSIRLASGESEKRVGLSAAQLFVLHKLGEENELSINDLAQRTLTHQSSVSVIVQKLVYQGLVMRSKSEEDARQLQISLTRKGRALLKKAPHAVQDILIAALKKMPPKSRKEFARTLSQFLDKAGISGKAASLLFDDSTSKKKRKK